MWTISFQTIPVLAWCFAMMFGVWHLRLGRRAFWCIAALLAVCFGKFAFFELAGGNTFVPDLPAGLIWTYGGIYGAAMLFAAFSFAARIADLFFAISRHPVSLRTRRWRALAMAAVATALAAWGMYEGVRTPDVKRVEISFEELPPAFDGYRIVQLSDTHCSTSLRRERTEGVVERVNSLDADLVALTGDYVDGRVADRRLDLEPFAKLKARDGVVGCIGNHEAFWEWDAWHALLGEWNVDILEEGHPRIIRRGNDALAIGGLTDPVLLRRRGKATCDAREAFAGVPGTAFRILLFHRPITEAVGSEAADVRLQLSGHTHGGALPGMHWLVALANEGHVRGLYEFAPGRYLYNSPGTGQWAGLPIRLIPAEITEITLRRGTRGR